VTASHLFSWGLDLEEWVQGRERRGNHKDHYMGGGREEGIGGTISYPAGRGSTKMDTKWTSRKDRSKEGKGIGNEEERMLKKVIPPGTRQTRETKKKRASTNKSIITIIRGEGITGLGKGGQWRNFVEL